jgi:hypothetical protein
MTQQHDSQHYERLHRHHDQQPGAVQPVLERGLVSLGGQGREHTVVDKHPKHGGNNPKAYT